MKITEYAKVIFIMIAVMIIHLPLFAISAYTWIIANSRSLSVVDLNIGKGLSTVMFIFSTVACIYAMKEVYCENKHLGRN